MLIYCTFNCGQIVTSKKQIDRLPVVIGFTNIHCFLDKCENNESFN